MAFNYHDLRLISIIFVLLVSLIIFYLLGTAVKRWFIKKKITEQSSGLGTLEGALLSLFAFFMAFSFSMSADRFNARRDAIINEANAIGTALLRADLYPDSIRLEFREGFKNYIESRIEYYEAGTDKKKVAASIEHTEKNGMVIWNTATKHSLDPKFFEPNRLMIPALNQMIDAVTTRDAALNANVPESIMWVLLILSLCSAFIVGYGSKPENVNYIVGAIFVIMISVSLTLIIDLDRPRKGMITNAESNQKVIDLRKMLE